MDRAFLRCFQAWTPETSQPSQKGSDKRNMAGAPTETASWSVFVPLPAGCGEGHAGFRRLNNGWLPAWAVGRCAPDGGIYTTVLPKGHGPVRRWAT